MSPITVHVLKCENRWQRWRCDRQLSTLQIGYPTQVHWQVSQLRGAKGDDVISVIERTLPPSGKLCFVKEGPVVL